MICGFLWVLQLPPSTNKTDRHDITGILLKVAWNTIELTLRQQPFSYLGGTWDFFLNYFNALADRFFFFFIDFALYNVAEQKFMLSPARKKILRCWIWVVNVLFLWKTVFLFHLIGKNIFTFLLMRKKYFDWGRFWKNIYEHNENPRPLQMRKWLLPYFINIISWNCTFFSLWYIYSWQLLSWC